MEPTKPVDAAAARDARHFGTPYSLEELDGHTDDLEARSRGIDQLTAMLAIRATLALAREVRRIADVLDGAAWRTMDGEPIGIRMGGQHE